MTSYRKISIASEKIINYRATSPSNHYCEIRVLAGEMPGILIIICCYLFLRQERAHANIFLHKNLCINTSQ